MRIIAGSRKSLPLKAPKGMNTRPTQDRTKETLFNVLRGDVYGARFLDLFSGSGAIALEALSRGAAYAVMVENSAEAVSCIRQNIDFTGFAECTRLMECDVLAALERLRGQPPFDIIFMDPPYKLGIEERVTGILSEADYVTDDTIVVAEAALETPMDFAARTGFEIYKTKDYKTNRHIFMRRK
ncbi:MAG: 16S rRNA (guanine(966)-N(2))-methyltransferase RsmD [Butyrivibrio sp.]|nr:16S rRNA (guanine(966)-N(2))-methyltransferase RsmD [Butyrivibrio sp.]